MQESQKQAIAEESGELQLPLLSNAAIRDELLFKLGSAVVYEITNDGHIIIDHKYYARAEYVLYKNKHMEAFASICH